MKTLILGSCRLREPAFTMKDMQDDIAYFPGGELGSTPQLIQSIKIVRGEIVVPNSIADIAFLRNDLEEKKVDLSDIERVILEVSTLDAGYLAVRWGVAGCVAERSNCKSIMEDLSVIKAMFPKASFLLMPVHNIGGERR